MSFNPQKQIGEEVTTEKKKEYGILACLVQYCFLNVTSDVACLVEKPLL